MTLEQSKGKTTTSILLALLIIGVVVIIYILYRVTSQPAVPAISQTEYTGTEYDPPVQLTEFTLPSSIGQPVSLSGLSGRWTVLFFGYTHCPDFCPLTLAEFKQIKSQLGDKVADVQFVFVSVDGKRDTPELLKAYLARFDSNFIGLSGDDQTLERIGADYGLFYQRHDDGGTNENYLVDHTTRLYLVDPQGLMRVTYAYGTEPETIAESIRQQMEKLKS